ncbi:unnamed protein product, partial [Polarella glacialis]
MAEPLREVSRSPRRAAASTATSAGEDCFALNARWWKTPGALASENLLSDYDRDEILVQNPLSGQLIGLNQYVITCDSQDSHLSAPQVPSSEWYAQTVQRRPHFGKELGKHEKRHSKIALLQRSYIEMVCQGEEQARIIIDAVRDFCFYVLTRPAGTQECSGIYDELNTEALPLTTMVFPELRSGRPPVHFTVTNMFRGMGAEEVEDLVRRLDSMPCTYPSTFCSLWVCTQEFGPLPDGYPYPLGTAAGDASVTEKLYTAILDALQE